MSNIKKKRIIVIIIALLLLLVWAIAVYRVNANGSETKYEYYEKGESCAYKGFDIKVCSHEGLNEEELKEKYGITREMLDVNYDIHIDVVWVEFTKTDADEANECKAECSSDLLLDEHYLFGKASRTIESEIIMSEDGKINNDLFYAEFNEGETKKVGLVYIFVTEGYSKKYFAKFEEYPLYLQFGDYERSQFICRLKVN